MYEYNGSAGLQKGLLAIGALGLALSACGGPEQSSEQQQGLGFRSITSVGPCDLAYTVVNVYPSTYWADDGDGIVEDGEIVDPDVQPINGTESEPGSGQVDPSQVGEVDDLDLGGLDTALDGVWWITDYFTLLDVGSYDVEVTIYDSGNNVIDTEIHNDVQVFSGQTTEDTFVFECDGTTIQGLDIVVLVNEGPSIIDFSYNNGKFHKVCGENCMTAGFAAGTDGEEITIFWEAYNHVQDAPFAYPGPHDDDETDTDQPPLFSSEDSIITAGESEWCFVCEEAGTFDIWITAQNTAGQITQFQALAHCDDPGVGYCMEEIISTPQDVGTLVQATDANFGTGLTINQVTFDRANLTFNGIGNAAVIDSELAEITLDAVGTMVAADLDFDETNDTAYEIGTVILAGEGVATVEYAAVAQSLTGSLGTWRLEGGRAESNPIPVGYRTLTADLKFGLADLATGQVQGYASIRAGKTYLGKTVEILNIQTLSGASYGAYDADGGSLGNTSVSNKIRWDRRGDAGAVAAPTCSINDLEKLDLGCVDRTDYFNYDEENPTSSTMWTPCKDLQAYANCDLAQP